MYFSHTNVATKKQGLPFFMERMTNKNRSRFIRLVPDARIIPSRSWGKIAFPGLMVASIEPYLTVACPVYNVIPGRPR
nr:MAG TPA: hypothetical protein [Caudoviricetes sp.]